MQEFRKVIGMAHNQTLAITIPHKMVEELHIIKGSFVKIRLEDGKILVEKVTEGIP